jgi:hypothetical protein
MSSFFNLLCCVWSLSWSDEAHVSDAGALNAPTTNSVHAEMVAISVTDSPTAAAKEEATPPPSPPPDMVVSTAVELDLPRVSVNPLFVASLDDVVSSNNAELVNLR